MSQFTKNQIILAVVLLVVVVAGVLYLRNPHLTVDESGSNAIFTVASTSGQIEFEVDNTGYVGIGTDHPTEPLEVAGSIRLTKASDEGCSPATEGTIAYNPANKHFWGCDGSAWRQLDQ